MRFSSEAFYRETWKSHPPQPPLPFCFNKETEPVLSLPSLYAEYFQIFPEQNHFLIQDHTEVLLSEALSLQALDNIYIISIL